MRRKGILFSQKGKINMPAKAASFSPECVCLEKEEKVKASMTKPNYVISLRKNRFLQ